MDSLSNMALNYTKEASVQHTHTGVPGHDTHIASVSDKHDTHPKNTVGADKLEQKYEQKHSKDPHAPVKAASEIEALGAGILKEISKIAEGQSTVSGTPGHDTGIAAVDAKHETTDKNAVGANKNEQKVEQEKAKEEVVHATQKAAAEQELSKVAQEELGRQLAAGLIASFSAKQEKVAMEKKAALEKEAGRRDFEVIASAAVDNLFKEKVAAEVAGVEAKYSEELGKIACDIYVKDQIIAAQKEELSKYASWFENLQQEVLKKEAEEKEMQKQAQFNALIERTLETKLAALLAAPAK